MSLLSANLQAFLAVQGQGTVHGAAQQLKLTQTGVTQRIRSLERDLGASLFLRSRRGMTLTPEGQALLRYCRGAEELEGEALSHIQGAALDRSVPITIAGPTSVMSARIARACLGLYPKWPRLQLNFLVNDSENGISLLRSGTASLALLAPSDVPLEMDSKRLRPERYLLVGCPRWKGRKLADILLHERMIDFHEADPTTRNYLRKHHLEAAHSQPRLFANNNEMLLQLVHAGVGYATLTQEVAKPHLESGGLVALNGGMAMEDPLALAWFPRLPMPEYFRAIVRAIS